MTREVEQLTKWLNTSCILLSQLLGIQTNLTTTQQLQLNFSFFVVLFAMQLRKGGQESKKEAWHYIYIYIHTHTFLTLSKRMYFSSQSQMLYLTIPFYFTQKNLTWQLFPINGTSKQKTDVSTFCCVVPHSNTTKSGE